MFVINHLFFSLDLEAAYKRACEEGSKEVFLARMNLVGFHEAGKTSLSKRLMGKDFDANVKSTEGVSIHYIRSTFNETDWKETEQDANELNNLVVDQMRKHLNKSSSTEKETEESPRDIPKEGSQSQTFRTVAEHSRDTDFQNLKRENIGNRAKISTMNTDQETGEFFETTQKIEPEVFPQLEESGKISTEIGQTETQKIQMDRNFNEYAFTQLYSHAEEDKFEKIPFTIRLWDLGGQNDFINTHHLFLDIGATTLIVMDITKKLHSTFDGEIKYGNPTTPAEVLCYWLNSFHVQSVGSTTRPNVAMVLTHTDILEPTERDWIIQNYKAEIMKIVESKPYSDLITEENIYAVDNRSSSDDLFINLKKQLLQNLTQQESWGKKIPTKWLKLEADILESKNREFKWIHLDHVKTMAASVGMENKEVDSFLQIHNNLGNFIHFGDSQLRHIVIIDPQWLVDMCKAVITHYDFLVERNISAATADQLKNGFVNNQSLSELWDGEELEFLTDLMMKFNLFLPVKDSQIQGQKYLVPCMLPSYPIYEGHHYEEMVCLYSALQRVRMGDVLPVGAFHKLLSVCSIKEKWTLSTECPLSYTTATLITKVGLHVEMSLQSSNDENESSPEVRTNIYCNESALRNDLTLAVWKTMQNLNGNMKLMSIAPPKLFDVLCPNFIPRNEQQLCMVEATEKYGHSVYLYNKLDKCECHEEPLLPSEYKWLIQSVYSK